MNGGNFLKYSLEDIERLLEETLIPVKPTQQYIHSLKQELQRKITSTPAVVEKLNKQTRILAIASAVGSGMLILNSLRALLSLIGVISIIHLLKQKSNRESLSASEIIMG